MSDNKFNLHDNTEYIEWTQYSIENNIFLLVSILKIWTCVHIHLDIINWSTTIY